MEVVDQSRAYSNLWKQGTDVHGKETEMRVFGMRRASEVGREPTFGDVKFGDKKQTEYDGPKDCLQNPWRLYQNHREKNNPGTLSFAR